MYLKWILVRVECEVSCRLSLFDVISASLSRQAHWGIPLRGLRMILFSAVCICWFDNPVIPASEGDSGSANTQQHLNSWTVTVPIVPPKQCLHFDVCDAWLAEGSFFNLCFRTKFPLYIHNFCLHLLVFKTSQTAFLFFMHSAQYCSHSKWVCRYKKVTEYNAKIHNAVSTNITFISMETMHESGESVKVKNCIF